MGGSGSGWRWRYGTRDTTDDVRKLDVRRWARDGFLTPGKVFGWRWTLNDETVASIRAVAEYDAVRLMYRARSTGEDWREMDYRVQLDRTPCHFGGERTWFLCPARGCGRRVALIYGGTVFACRHCHDLAYPSQNEDAMSRALRRSRNIEARLGWDDSFGRKPKGMHWKTFERLVAEHDDAEAKQAAGFLQRWGQLEGFINLMR